MKQENITLLTSFTDGYEFRLALEKALNKEKLDALDYEPLLVEMATNNTIEGHGAFEDFGYDSSEIAETLESMRSEFIEKYLNEASQENWLDYAAVPFDKRDILKKEIKHDGVDYFTGNLVFEDGDKNIIPGN